VATIKPGDYFYSSWGYDQTNIDYLVVTEVSPTGKTAKCRMVSRIDLGTSGVHNVSIPATPYGPTFRMKIKEVCGETCLKGSYPYIYDDPDERRLGVFFPTSLAEPKYEAMPEFGH